MKGWGDVQLREGFSCVQSARGIHDQNFLSVYVGKFGTRDYECLL
jgi:hypothetical protein